MELLVSLTVVAAIGIIAAAVLDIRSNREAAEMKKLERKALHSIARAR
jgi:hypothetical protein